MNQYICYSLFSGSKHCIINIGILFKKIKIVIYVDAGSARNYFNMFFNLGRYSFQLLG